MKGGSYVKRGDKLERVEGTEPAPARPASAPEAPRPVTARETRAAPKVSKES
jgi:hypothetical protein